MYYIIFNPTAGAGRSHRALETVEQILKEKRIEYTVGKTEYKRHAISLAKDAVGKGFDGIISVGGDGTLLEVAQSLKGTQETLGIIPAGTGNDFRAAVGVPAQTEQALDIIIKGNSRRVDVGLIGGEYTFLNVAGTGFDVDVIRNTNKVRRAVTGGMAYLLGIIMSILGHKSVKLRITADGRELRRDALLIAVANGKCYGGGLMISPGADAADGLFNIVIINSLPKRRILFELPKLKRGELEKIPVAEQLMCSEITIDCDRPMPFNVDGELYGQTPMTIKVLPGALNVFCP